MIKIIQIKTHIAKQTAYVCFLFLTKSRKKWSVNEDNYCSSNSNKLS